MADKQRIYEQVVKSFVNSPALVEGYARGVMIKPSSDYKSQTIWTRGHYAHYCLLPGYTGAPRRLLCALFTGQLDWLNGRLFIQPSISSSNYHVLYVMVPHPY
jgi:hypothetical protein